MSRHVLCIALVVTTLTACVPTQDAHSPAAQALADLRASAEAGDAEAQRILGGMYVTGAGVPQDATEAVAWYRRAAEAVAGRSAVSGEHSSGPGTAPRRPPLRRSRRRGRRRGARGEVGGQGRVIELPAIEPSVELAEGAGVGSAGVVAHRGVDQAARGHARMADRGLSRSDHGERILHDNGNYRE